MKKVKITTEQENLIKTLKNSYEHKLPDLFAIHLKGFVVDKDGKLNYWMYDFSPLNNITPAEMSLILFFDHYELKFSKEEELLDFYNRSVGNVGEDVSEFDAGIRLGVETALSIYEIEVKGINK